jgi:hypothetical protein
MTDQGNTLRRAQRLIAVRYRRLRTAHPVYVLEWLRNGVLLAIAAAALLYLLVAIQASSDIGTAIRTHQAVHDISRASDAVAAAGTALTGTLTLDDDLQLTGIGSEYFSDISEVSIYLTLAAENNGAGTDGTTDIQFAQGQLDVYQQASETAVTDYELGSDLGLAGEKYAASGAGDLTTALIALQNAEQAALSGQRGAWPINPAAFWWVLLGPVIAVLMLAVATIRVLARHFRRHVSPWLWGSLLTVTATAVTAGFLNVDDERTPSQHPLAGNPVSLACALALFLAAAVMAQLAYRRRLADYRFESA